MTPQYRLVRPRTVDRRPPALDESQQAVVEHPGGPVLVLAGPGTGKTTTLVEAVVDRIERRGVDAERVLVLTFSRKAAAELRDRIATRLDRTIREPLARTFHSYAFGLLRREAAAAGLPSPRLLTGPEHDLIVRDLLRGDRDGAGVTWPDDLDAALGTRGFAQELRDFVSRCTERGIDAETLRTMASTAARPEWHAAADFSDQYAQVTRLRDVAAYDPAELIRAALAVLEADDGALAARERAAYDCVFVDEYQDADPSQELLLRTIVPRGGDLVVVGDPNQSIYAFRGADVRGIDRFPTTFPTSDGSPTPVVALTVNRRSSAELVDAGEQIARRLRTTRRRARPSLTAEPGRAAGRCDVYVAASRSQEAQLVAGVLRRARLEDDVPYDRMAVLVRSTRGRLGDLRRGLLAAGVPVEVPREEIPLREQPGVRPLLDVVRVALDESRLDESLAVALLTGPLGGVDALDLRRLRRALRGLEGAGGGTRHSGLLLLEALSDRRAAITLPDRLARPLQRVASLIEAARRSLAEGGSPESVLWEVWSGSGLAGRWAEASAAGGSRGAAADRDLDAVMALFDAAARFVDRLPRAGIEVFLDDLGSQEIPGDGLTGGSPPTGSVALMTAHAAKGLEWDVVVVAGVQDGVWPDLRQRGSLLGVEDLLDVVQSGGLVPGSRTPALLDEERRLFYVACTRARERLVVTAVGDNDEGDQPSRFTTEVELAQDALPVLGRDESGVRADGDTTVAALRARVPVPELLSLYDELANDEAQPTETRTRVAQLRSDAASLARALDLGSLVAELRSVSSDPDRPEEQRTAAAGVLGGLADEGVAGASAAEWYGFAELSDTRPLHDADDLVPVSPSKVESFRRCELRWLLESVGAEGTPGSAQSIGSLIHELAELAARDPGLTVDDLLARLDDDWDDVGLPCPWESVKQRRRARTMLTKLVDWLAANPRRLVGAELTFDVVHARARLRGRVDRLELDEHGRGHVVDFKTGKSQPAKDEELEHPQLGAYQVAAQVGAFAHLGVDVAGGARLVQLGRGTKSWTEQVQPALEIDAVGGSWAHALVGEVADGMAGLTFVARVNDHCEVCPVARSCPLQDGGRQVTS